MSIIIYGMDENIRVALEKQNPWWFDKPFDTGIERLRYYPSILKYLEVPEILLLAGARRTGKSTLLYQVIKHLIEIKNISSRSILFINLDEPLFQSKSEDPAFLSRVVGEYSSENQETRLYLFIDEIQNYDYWVQTTKILFDTQKNIKIILTGSTSTLLKGAITTNLAGRCLSMRVYPLSFQEYMDFRGVKKPTILEKKQEFETYLKFGAFPRVVLERDERIKQDILKNYFQTIYLKDIIYPHNLRSNRDVFDLLYFLISNVGRLLSYSKIARILNISVDTVKEYIEYAEESYLISSITKFDHSIKKQMANPKKIYCLDTGLVNSVSFKFSENRGWLLENLAYTTLSRQEPDVYYHREKYECDFLIKDNLKIRQAIQVAASLMDEKTRKREIKGLLEAMKSHGIKVGSLITEDGGKEIHAGGKTIAVKQFYEWVMEKV